MKEARGILVRITANARLKQAVHYYNIAAANLRQNKQSIANRFFNISIASLEKYKSALERGVRLNKLPEEEVMPLLDNADSIIHEINHLMGGSDHA